MHAANGPQNNETQAGAFAVMRKCPPLTDTLLQEKLKMQISACNEEVERIRCEEDNRVKLVMRLEQEAFQKAQELEQVEAEITKLCSQNTEIDRALATPDGTHEFQTKTSSEKLAMIRAEQKQAALEKMHACEAKARDLKNSLQSLTATVEEKRLEDKSKNDIRYHLLYQLSHNAQELTTSPFSSPSPLEQVQPRVVKTTGTEDILREA